MVDNIIVVGNIFWYIFLFGLFFLLGTFIISVILSISLGDFNFYKNTLFVFRSQNDIISEEIERRTLLNDLFENFIKKKVSNQDSNL